VNDLGLCTIDHSEDEISPSLPPFGLLFIYTLLFLEVSGTADALAGASETKQRRQAQHKKGYQILAEAQA
jgi:hypothetical protein